MMVAPFLQAASREDSMGKSALCSAFDLISPSCYGVDDLDDTLCSSSSTLWLTPSLPPPEEQSGRRVAFLVDKFDRDLLEICDYELPSVEDWPNLYSSREEKAEFMEHARQEADDFMSRYPGRIRHLEKVFRNCGSSSRSVDADEISNSSSGSHHHSDSSLSTLSEASRRNDMYTLRRWSATTGRGIEDCVTRAFKRDRRENIRNILQYANFLRRSVDVDDTTEVDEALRQYSEFQSKRTRDFAHKLALADEFVCQERGASNVKYI